MAVLSAIEELVFPRDIGLVTNIGELCLLADKNDIVRMITLDVMIDILVYVAACIQSDHCGCSLVHLGRRRKSSHESKIVPQRLLAHGNQKQIPVALNIHQLFMIAGTCIP